MAKAGGINTRYGQTNLADGQMATDHKRTELSDKRIPQKPIMVCGTTSPAPPKRKAQLQ